MTSSFTNMYLAAWLSLQKNDISRYEDPVKEIARCGRQFLEEGYKKAEELVQEYPFDRIVCLGTGSLKGFAQEAALKVCELTQGKVDTVFNSPMGFRHGPKSVIKDTALTLVFLSEDPYCVWSWPPCAFCFGRTQCNPCRTGDCFIQIHAMFHHA